MYCCLFINLITMPGYCAAVNCFSRSGQGITFHKFPSDEFYRKKWLLAVRRKDFVPTKYSALCTKHFTPDCYTCKACSSYLNKDAVPTIFDYSSDTKYKPRKCAKNEEIGKDLEFQRRFPIDTEGKKLKDKVIDPLYTDRRDFNDCFGGVRLNQDSEHDSSERKSPYEDITAELRYQDVLTEMNRRVVDSTTTMPVILNLGNPLSSTPRRLELPIFVKDANKKIYTILSEEGNSHSKLLVNDTNIEVSRENISQLLVDIIAERNNEFPNKKYRTHIIVSNNLEKSGEIFFRGKIS